MIDWNNLGKTDSGLLVPIDWNNPVLPEPIDWNNLGLTSSLSHLTTRQQSILALPPAPEPEKPKGLLSKFTDVIVGAAGDVLGTAADIFQWPSEQTERFLGTVYSFTWDWNASLAQRWEAGQLFYEDVLPGDAPGDTMSEALAILQSGDDAAAEDFIRQHEGGWTNTFGQILLDPLWLVGGIPMIRGAAKLAKIDQTPILGQTINFLGTGITRRTPLVGPIVGVGGDALRRVPVLGSVFGRVGVSPIEEAIRNGPNKLVDRHLFNALNGSVDTQPGFMESLQRVIPQGQADNLVRQMHSALAPVIKSPLFTPESALQLGNALHQPTFQDMLKALPPGLNNNVFVKNPTGYAASQGIGEYMRAVANRPVQLDRRRSVSVLDVSQFDSMKPHYVNTITDRASLQKWQNAFYDELTSELHERTIAALKLSGALDEPLGSVYRVTSAMKMALANTVLNTPRFVFLNIANNLFTWAFDWTAYFDDEPHKALSLLTPAGQKARLAELGFLPRDLQPFYKDPRSLTEDVTGILGREAGLARNKQSWWNKGAVGVKLATRVDNFFREQSMIMGIMKARHWVKPAVWQNVVEEVRRTNPELVGALSDSQLDAIMRSAPEVNDPEAVQAWFNEIRHIYAGDSAYNIAYDWAARRAAGAGPEAINAYLEDLGEEVIRDVNAALHNRVSRPVPTGVAEPTPPPVVAEPPPEPAPVPARRRRPPEPQVESPPPATPPPPARRTWADLEPLDTIPNVGDRVAVHDAKNNITIEAEVTAIRGRGDPLQTRVQVRVTSRTGETREFSLPVHESVMRKLPEKVEAPAAPPPPDSVPATPEPEPAPVEDLEDAMENAQSIDELLGLATPITPPPPDIPTEVRYETIEDVVDALRELRGRYAAADMAASMLDEVPIGPHPAHFDSFTGQKTYDEALNRQLLARQLGQQYQALEALGIPDDLNMGLMRVGVAEYAQRAEKYNEAWAEVDRGWKLVKSGKHVHGRRVLQKAYDQMEQVRLIEHNIFRERAAATLELLEGYDMNARAFMKRYFDLVDSTLADDLASFRNFKRDIRRRGPNFIKQRYSEMALERAEIWQRFQEEAHVVLGGVGTGPLPHQIIERPTLTGMTHTRFQAASEYIDEVINHLQSPRAMRDAVEAPALDLQPLVDAWVNNIDFYRSKVLDAGTAVKDFVMLDYDNQRGWERAFQFLFPYEFWPTRTVWHWSRRAIARPGAISGLLHLNERLREINEDFPARFSYKIRIPFPGLGDVIPGAADDLFVFDPLQMMFPFASWVNDYDYADRTSAPNIWQRAMDAAQITAPNPLLVSGARLAGALPGEEREAFSFVRGGLPFVGPLGGTQFLRGLMRYLQTGDLGNDPDGRLAEAARQVLAKGYLPEDLLLQAVGLEPGDRWDEYRFDRAMASVVAERARGLDPEERQELVREALHQLYDGKGDIYDAAKKFANQERGLAELTGWLLGGGGVNIWHEGEQLQRGLQALFSEAAANGTLDQFFERFPEYRVRQVALAGLGDTGPGMPEREVELHTSLWFMDLAQIIKEEDAVIGPLIKAREHLNAQIDVLNRSDLTLRVVREQRRALIEKAQALSDEIEERRAQFNQMRDDLDTAYPLAKTDPSYRRAPADRAMTFIANEYFNGIRDVPSEERAEWREKFLSQFPARSRGYDPMEAWQLSVRAIEIIRDYDQRMRLARSDAERDQLEEARNAFLDLLTDEARQQFSRRDVEERLRLISSPPTPQLLEYYEAVRLFQEYDAIPSENKEARRAFWNSHPLLEKYYGLESYAGHPDEARQRAQQRYFDLLEQGNQLEGAAREQFFAKHRTELNELRNFVGPTGDPDQDRWSEIWAEYYSLPRSQRDVFLDQHRREIDELQRRLGKEPSPKARAAAREAGIWSHYFSLSKGAARRNYLLFVAPELNEVRAILGKAPITVGAQPENAAPIGSLFAPQNPESFGAGSISISLY